MIPGQIDHFPLTVADQFYDDPDAIRNYALSLNFLPAQNGEWPGKRTPLLSTLNQELNNYCITKFVSLYFDLSISEVRGWNAETQFQLIDPFDKDKTNIKNKAWVHVDTSPLAGVVYLNPNADLNSGTSIYKLKEGAVPDWLVPNKRTMLHTTGNIDANYKHNLQKHSNCFDETISVKNVYNRIIAYEGTNYHCASNHHAGSPRLTQVFFLYQIDIKSWPAIDRIKKMPSVNNFIK
jgi:hypothetical protein